VLIAGISIKLFCAAGVATGADCQSTVTSLKFEKEVLL
jgi:hypothetical protein